ncbi:MAG: hypothetical protein JSR54_15855 [Proteobacteria bacterium]|nr:hypothetical protein [Pseudomonadota bacterium]
MPVAEPDPRALRIVVTFGRGETPAASLEIRLACWLGRVARLLARRDTPRDDAPPPGAATP